MRRNRSAIRLDWSGRITPGTHVQCLPPRGDVKLPAIFGSHMVLERDQKDRVWGWAEPGEDVTIKIGGQTHTAKAGADGSWQVMLDPMPAGGPHTLTIEGKNTVKFDDVLVGEVWICSGQSNMQWPVAASNDADLEIATAKYPHIRFITVPNRGMQEPQKDFHGQWQPCRPDTIGGLTAVGYFFGRRLHQVAGRSCRLDQRLVGWIGM